MPVSRVTTEGLADKVAGIYGSLEVRLLRMIAEHLAAGRESPTWLEDKLAEVQMMRHRVAREASVAEQEAIAQVVTALRTAYLRGAAEGQGDLDHLHVETDAPPRHAERAILALVRAEQQRFAGLSVQIARAVGDAYADVIHRAAAGTLTGATTRLQDAQHALDELARRGIGAFVDKSGRRWGLRSYVEMATRTVTAQAAVQGHLDRLEDAGLPLVIVSDSTRECPKCRPWEGKVLARGPVSALLPNAVTGKLERVPVDGTVDEAVRAGLMHPNCTHNLSAFIPGATSRGATANPKGYAEKVEQRRLERQVRAWKQREAVAVTPEAKRAARAKVRAWQGELSAHVDATGLPRKRNRESLTAAR